MNLVYVQISLSFKGVIMEKEEISETRRRKQFFIELGAAQQTKQ